MLFLSMHITARVTILGLYVCVCICLRLEDIGDTNSFSTTTAKNPSPWLNWRLEMREWEMENGQKIRGALEYSSHQKHLLIAPGISTLVII